MWWLRRRRWHALCEQYELSPTHGFVIPTLPRTHPQWEELALNSFSLEYIDSMPILEPSGDLRRCYVLLGMALQKYAQRSRTIPPALAVPWAAVCDQLGLPAGALAACGTDLWNDTVSMSGTATERAFHQLARRIIIRGATLIQPLMETPANSYALVRSFLEDARRIFDDVWRDVDPHVFYQVYRPLLAGSWDDPLTLLTDPPRVVRAKGPSAGQTTLFVMIDFLLLDQPQRPGPHTDFQTDMLDYMPLPHRRLLQAFVANLPSDNYPPEKLKAREALVTFRRFHATVATRYLKRTSQGTGNSDFQVMLRDAIAKSEPDR